jgi:hypothetical protein
VKFCISSRPWPSLKHACENRPRLRLQDLISSDIEQYIHDELKDSKRMAYLTEKEPVCSIGLFKDVVNKADGVFLWVTLVVKSVLKGLTNKDSVYYPEKRLQSVPADLEDFYDHVLARIMPNTWLKRRGFSNLWSMRVGRIWRMFTKPMRLICEERCR